MKEIIISVLCIAIMLVTVFSSNKKDKEATFSSSIPVNNLTDKQNNQIYPLIIISSQASLCESRQLFRTISIRMKENDQESVSVPLLVMA